MANKQTPYIATNTEKHTNIPPFGGWFVAFLAIPLMIFALSFQAAPVRAQSVFVTPTPIPAVVATQNAAQAAQSAANASRSEAASLRARADEIQRNADAQAQQAANALADARAAAASQNAAAVGEAIGSADNQLSQLRASVEGQAEIIATLTADKQASASEIYSLTTALQQERTSKQTILDNYTAANVRLESAQAEIQRQSGSSPVAAMVFVVGGIAIFAVLIVVVLQRRERVTVTNDAGQDDNGDVIDGEVTP